jgi:predicted metalloendopeptidase
MKKQIIAAAAALLATMASAAEKSGIDLQYIDPAIRAQDDFFKHLNGKWLATAEIPAEMSSWGVFEKLFEDIQPQLRKIIEDSTQAANSADKKRIGDFYAAFMPRSTWVSTRTTRTPPNTWWTSSNPASACPTATTT